MREKKSKAQTRADKQAKEQNRAKSQQQSHVIRHYYLGMSEEELKAKMDAVAKQGSAQK